MLAALLSTSGAGKKVEEGGWAGLSQAPVGSCVSSQDYPQEHLPLEERRENSGADGGRGLAPQQQQYRLAQLPFIVYGGG